VIANVAGVGGEEHAHRKRGAASPKLARYCRSQDPQRPGTTDSDRTREATIGPGARACPIPARFRPIVGWHRTRFADLIRRIDAALAALKDALDSEDRRRFHVDASNVQLEGAIAICQR